MKYKLKKRSPLQILRESMPEWKSKRGLLDERTQLMIDATPLCVSVIDKDYTIIGCNTEAVKLFGMCDKREYIEKFWELQPEYQTDGGKSTDRIRELVKKAYEDGRCHFEWVHQKINGELIPSEVTLVRAKYRGDYIVLAYMRDLREHKRMISEIKRMDDLLRTVNLAATAMLTTADDTMFDDALLSGMEHIGRAVSADRVQIWKNEEIDGELHFVHKYEWLSEIGKQKVPVPIGLKFPYSDKPEWERMFLRDEYINSPLSDLPENDQAFLNAYDMKSIVIIPLFLQERFWGFFSLDDCKQERAFPSDEINILRSASLMMASALLRNDIMQNARAAAVNLKAVVANYPGVICAANRDLQITLFDGLLLSTLIDKDLFYEGQTLQSALQRKEYKHIIEKVFKTFEEGVQDWTFEIHNKVVHMTTSPISDGDGNVSGVVGRIDDVTEVAQLQKELETAYIEAKEASIAKSRFLANMSHEIRTPMNSIIGFSELALDSNIPLKTREYLGKIKENADWLLQIINDLLDIAKIESGKLELEHIPFDLHEIFAYCQTAIMPKALEQGLSMHFYAEPYIGKRLLGDPTRLRQVLINLLSNAVKFTNIGTVKVSSDILNSTGASITMRFEVRDSGIGMTPEQISKIFEPFSQADASMTRRYGGTGLGIPITQNIIQIMGGNLVVESMPGIGSKFSFDLTFDTIDVPVESSKDIIKINDFEKPIFKGEILICEDNAMNQQVICDHLARVGLQSVVANNGKEGVDIVKKRINKGEKPFDLIFMDINMPVMDGLQAATIIAGLQTETPIVAMTANIMPSDRDLYEASGLPDCVGKPFTSQELWQCLKKYLIPVSIGTVNNKQQLEEDTKLARQLQINFVKDNQEKYHEIVGAIHENDIMLAHRLAHTLKGNAGQIGKKDLQNAAAKVERLLTENDKNPFDDGALSLLEAELDAVLKELTPLLDQTRVSTKPFDRGQALLLFDALEAMLQSRNPECQNLLDDIYAVPGAEVLAEQVDNFDFKAAIATLSELKEKWG